MYYTTAMIVMAAILLLASCSNSEEPRPATKASSLPASAPVGEIPPLNDSEKKVILNKGTERPFTGKFWNSTDKGVYLCRQCGAPLYLSDAKFESHCGWPSFDDEIPGAVKRQMDADGSRTEILCVRCGGHLGHVFLGEGFTARNTRHCVNSASLLFLPENKWPLQRAIFAGGCFWGVEYQFRQVPGVVAIRSGFIGGKTQRPTYKQVCTGETGHAEAVEILFDPSKVSYEQLAWLFFEIHDPTQKDRQGPDWGTQYRSGVFYVTDEQKAVAEKLIGLLRERKFDVVTEVTKAATFWPAEDYHQDYFNKNPQRAHCHAPVNRFGSATRPAGPAEKK